MFVRAFSAFVLLASMSIFAVLLVGCTSSSTRYASKDVSWVDSTSRIPESVSQYKVSPEKIPDRTGAIKRTEYKTSFDRHAVLSGIMQLMGTPYLYNGNSTNGFDCSGFTASVFAKSMQQTLPHSSQEQYAMGSAVEQDRLEFGDLVFFDMEGSGPSHVGIYLGDGLFAHASVSLGVTVSLLDSSYYKKRYLGAKRIVR